jgi:hypothetical protein
MGTDEKIWQYPDLPSFLFTVVDECLASEE